MPTPPPGHHSIAPAAPLRTTLHPAARVVWRSHDEIQIELGERRIVVAGLESAAVRHLVGRAGRDDDPPRELSRVQRDLVEAGFLWPVRAAAPAAGDPREASPAGDRRRLPPVTRLAPELTALAARLGEDAADVLAARRHRSVAIDGPGRVGPLLAAVLGAAGVGRVSLTSTEVTRLHHLQPGGAGPEDEGTALRDAAAAAVARSAPDAVTVALPPTASPDLLVIARDEQVDADHRAVWHRLRWPHLLVRTDAAFASVGPLVVPGETSCLNCADLHRLDRDPAWPALATQLTVVQRAASCGEVAVTTMLAGLAAHQVLAFLDGGRPGVEDGSLELHPPDWRVRRRPRARHPDCDCAGDPG